MVLLSLVCFSFFFLFIKYKNGVSGKRVLGCERGDLSKVVGNGDFSKLELRVKN